MIRLLICEGSEEARYSLRAVLADQPEIEIVAEAANGDEAVSLALAQAPDVVLIDEEMPVLDGITAARRIRELLPATRIVAYAGPDNPEVVTAMIDAGANAHCLKGAPLWELERAIAGASDPLLTLAHGLARTADGTGTAELVARELADLTGAAFAGTYLGEAGAGLALAGRAGPCAPGCLDGAPGIVRRALSESAVVRAAPHELAELLRLGVPCAEAVAAPLVADGEGFGALLVAMAAHVQLRADPELVRAVAELAAASLVNERRLALTLAEARRDPLTGLPNRRAFDEHLERAIRTAAERRGEVAVALVDLDDFKQVNDREGHLTGDRVLRRLGRVILSTIRADEDVFRIGGDEFAIVLEGGKEAATRLAERVRGAVLRRSRGARLPTLSVGVASLDAELRTTEELLRRADVALYAAKRAGKNQLVVYSAGCDDHAPGGSNGRSAGGRREHGRERADDAGGGRGPAEGSGAGGPRARPGTDRGLRLLIVDDDASLRMLLRTTFDVIDIEVEEAESAAAAAEKIATRHPDVVLLDVCMPGLDGLSFCRNLKSDPATRDIRVVLLTGLDMDAESVAGEAGADALLPKPFSPLELLSVVEQLLGGLYEGPFRGTADRPPEEQILLYAEDLRRLLELERGQRVLLQQAYRETVTALASALESKDSGTGAHSQRVQRYASELARAIEPRLLDDPSLEYGFLLHDVGKIAVPDEILQKPGPLASSERRLLETHTLLGEQLLGGVASLQGAGIQVVRSHHERWEGGGYPDGLAGDAIPISARVFAVADALDAMTSDRPYRSAGSWHAAVKEILDQSGRQFDPAIVEAFRQREAKLRRIYYEFSEGLAHQTSARMPDLTPKEG